MLFRKILRFFSGYEIRFALRVTALQNFAMATESDDRESKREKLRGFENWPQWADLTQAMLEEKEVWDVVDGTRPEPTTATQTKKKDKDNAIASKIIKQGVNSDLYTNIIGERDPHRSWETLRRVCSQVGQGVVYSILKELLNYPRVVKPLGYEKKATTIFAEVKQLVQRLQSAVTEHRRIWDSITLVVALDSLHDDFEMTTAPLLHSGDKNLEEIQQIVTSTEAANMAKRATGQIADLAMMAKKRTDSRQQSQKPKNNEECFNCGKKGHYARDCYSTTSKRKPEDEKAAEEAKRAQWKRNQATEKAAAARSANQDQDDSDHDPYPAGRAFMTRHSSDKVNDTWYLDSCASRHICNNRVLFSDIRSKNYKFITAGGEIIHSQEVGTVHLTLQSGKTTMTLLNVAYAPKCDSNLISLGQLRKSGISYHDHPDSMALKQGGSTLGVANRHKNLFVLETGSKAKAMLVKGRGRPTYLLSKNPQIRLWHRRLGHASNARIVEASKLTDGIDITIEEGQQIQEEPFSSDSEVDDEDENSEPSPVGNTPPVPATTLLNKVTSTGTDPDHSVE